MMNFKFLTDNYLMNDLYEPQYDVNPPVNRNVPTHYYRTNIAREDIPEATWYNLLRQQRQRLAELMWQEGMVSHTIIYQDENGLTLRTEFLF